ncbi:MAG: inorganic phosphate transporter [Verrucomicrobia bacterium]|nr:inorganic phosphate transporter [Verrucomicrobiota bacterium]OQC26656.1 MAG: Low-affinity inorganic phosphate transporter 1 [Verrucomicrobia bacterium ADurb.Bin063]HNW06176.1 inorganic phosphate transporter [Verrucomicrobiota bacterium]HOC49759.1 inorganic phosphate transporter [Verrucomicrobiota bacterium]HOX61378.1 inorganic phosphate transporter [Verrucomicrobiota bacterium]
MTLLFSVILVALIFEYINGFHDTANSIATVVATKVLTPRQAVLLAAVTNLLGALWGTAVAQTISSGLVDTRIVLLSPDIMICALLGAILWNLLTWWLGLPSSSSHALIGGLCGAALAASDNRWQVIVWSQHNPQHWYQGKGLLWKVIVPMFTSPLAGLLLGFLVMALLYRLLRHARPGRVNRFFGKAQMLSAGAMGFMHGTNDAQKTMGIIALSLLGATTAGQLDNLPGWLSFLHTPPPPPGADMRIAWWIKVVCALTMAAGTAAGGWRIIKTLGHKMVKLHPIHGFAAETSSAAVILTATHFGIPLSTTHNISAAIMGVGAAKSLNAIKWTVVESMAWAWLLTLPISGALAYGLVRLLR